MSGSTKLWIAWVLATLAAGAVLVAGAVNGGFVRQSFLIGKTTSGHHQIELACNACHGAPFAGREAIEENCLSCHKAELAASKDSHPAKKFRDPRNADRLEKLAANKCITCHTEHKPDITNAMGVTLPIDYCALCHQDVGKNRKSHIGLGYDTCASAGCHNYHDNTALYEDFLEKHAGSAALKEKPIAKLYTEAIEIEAVGPALTTAASADAPRAKLKDAVHVRDWIASSHAFGGVNCSACHAPGAKSAYEIAAGWLDKPSHKTCANCHKMESATWVQGKHGMRLAEGMLGETAAIYGLFRDKPLTPMRPQLARLAMKPEKSHAELTCTSCHGAHTFDTKTAAAEVCMSCHADEHTRAYEGSPHHKLWEAELSGSTEKGRGVSCATCHMPRTWMEDESGYEEILLANHNQNANLRPNEKMIRSVCLNCHGLGFSIDALADDQLIKRNFKGKPSTHVESIDWVMRRLEERKQETD